MLYDPKWNPSEIKTAPWRDLLRAAADVLERYGWGQGRIMKAGLTGQPIFCLAGAISYAAMQDRMPHAQFSEDSFILHIRNGDKKHEINEALQAVSSNLYLYGKDTLTAWKWNDATGRTKEEVIAKLREVADA